MRTRSKNMTKEKKIGTSSKILSTTDTCLIAVTALLQKKRAIQTDHRVLRSNLVKIGWCCTGRLESDRKDHFSHICDGEFVN